jgi:uncharacterized protein YjdB
MRASEERAGIFVAARVAVSAAFVLAACDNGPTRAGPAVASVEVDPSSASLQIGAAIPLAATVLDESGNVITDRTVVWSSSNASIATVNAVGLVTAHQAGSAQIAASAGGASGIATVEVRRAPVTSVTISPDRATVRVGETRTLSLSVRDAQGDPVTDRPATWTSSDQSVVTVSSSGVVTAKSSGSATVSATVDGVTGRSEIEVPVVEAPPPPQPPPPPPGPQPVARVEVQPSSLTVEEDDDDIQLTAVLFDAQNNVLTGREVSWTTNDGRICTVNGSGRVNPRREGTCVVTATSEGKSGSSTIRIEDD